MGLPTTPEQIAHAVLTYLKVNDDSYYRNVRAIVIGIANDCNNGQYFNSFYVRCREVITRLHMLGKLDKKEGGKAYNKFKKGTEIGKPSYILKVDSWDENDPFDGKGHGGAGSNESSNDDELKEKINLLQSKLGDTLRLLKEKDDFLKKKEEIINNLEQELTHTKEMKELKVKTIHIKKYDGKEKKLKSQALPKVYQRILDLALCRRNILLVGPAGCGKTFLGKLVADSMLLDFESISCTSGISEAHLLGRSVPDLTHGKNRFQGTPFLKCYEEGGIFLADELDAADPNLLLALNSALANQYCNVPNRPDNPKATRHQDFIFIGTANTTGRGATRLYSGRNQLDEATLDRFRIGFVECGYDAAVEMLLCPDQGVGFVPPPTQDKGTDTVPNLLKLGYGLRGTCQYIRHKIEASGMRRIMSSRFMEDAYIMHTSPMLENKWDIATILNTYFEGWSPEEKAKIA